MTKLARWGRPAAGVLAALRRRTLGNAARLAAAAVRRALARGAAVHVATGLRACTLGADAFSALRRILRDCTAGLARRLLGGRKDCACEQGCCCGQSKFG